MVINVNNTITYYYDIRVDKIKENKDNEYLIYSGSDIYKFMIYNRSSDDIFDLYNLNKEMINNNYIVDEIILNKNNNLLTNFDNKPFILIKLDIRKYSNKHNFNYYNNVIKLEKFKKINRCDWISMWCEKIDYYEYQISQFGNKYPILGENLPFFIGISENAIQYLIYNINNNYTTKPVVSHKRLFFYDYVEDFYNPLNIIIDSRVRDVAEYIKNMYFNGQFNLDYVKRLIYFSNFSRDEFILLFSRLLFPSYYYDQYDEIINNGEDEKKIINIIDKIDGFLDVIREIYFYIVNDIRIYIPQIEWLIKKDATI